MAEQTDHTGDRTIKPLYMYFQDSDIKCKDNGRVTDFDLMESVTFAIWCSKIVTFGVFI